MELAREPFKRYRCQMVGRTFVTLVALLSLVALVAGPRLAGATSCEVPTPANGDEHADVVFEAACEGDSAVDVTRLRVTKVYKGTVPNVVTARYGGMKGFSRFDKGKRYLVWGRIADEGLSVHLCSPTHELPAPEMFTEGPWKDWSAEAHYGAPREPGGTLSAGSGATAKTNPEAPVDPAVPAPDAHESVEVVPSAPAPSSAPPASGGCAGCSVAEHDGNGGWVLLFGLAALVALTRRRVGPSGV